MGFIALQMTLIFAASSATDMANSSDNGLSMEETISLRLSCLISQSRRIPLDFYYQLFWDLVAVLYYISILTKIYTQTTIQRSSSLVGRTLSYVFDPISGPSDYFRGLHGSRLPAETNFVNRNIQRAFRCLAQFESAYFKLKRSVFSDIPWLLLILTFSIIQIFSIWLAPDSAFRLHDGPQTVGFGQLTALILLAVPLLNAWDIVKIPSEITSLTIIFREDDN
jgi:hypothetical protein